MNWARERMLDDAGALSVEERGRELGGSFGSIQGVLQHLVWAEETWKNRLYGSTEPPVDPASLAEFDSLRRHWIAIAGQTRAWAGALPEGNVDAAVEYLHRSGTRYRTPVDGLIQHLSHHQTYHRGQVAHMLRQLGYAPASTDLIFYLRERGE